MERVSVVLMRPIYPRNIGMCARSMANMGVHRLILVAPQCELDENAKQGATNAQHVLRNAVTYPSLQAFYEAEGNGVRIALSGRGGRLREPDRLDEKLRELSKLESPQIHDRSSALYMIFGPEDDGLNDEEICDVHHVCALPTYGEFFSMNLSHAVMLALYVLRSHFTLLGLDESERGPGMHGGREPSPDRSEGELLKERLKQIRAPKYFPDESIDRWLTTLGFDIDSRRVNISRMVKRILLENEPTQDELRILDTVLQQTIRKLNSSAP